MTLSFNTFKTQQLSPKSQIVAKEGISLQEIKKSGSYGQVIAAPLFDYNNNGKLEGEEVDNFNDYKFDVKEDESGTKTLTLSRWAKKGLNYDRTEVQLDRTTVIKYESLEQLYDTESRQMYARGIGGNYVDKYDNPATFKTAINEWVNIGQPYKSAVIDLKEKRVIVDGMEQQEYKSRTINASNFDVTVKNSDIDHVVMRNGSLRLENTYSYSFYAKPIDVATNGVDKVKVTKDNKSLVNIFTWGEIAR